ncbi:MAG: nucleotidyltransferase domain-containing protein, partial [Candidatus Bathyarchaeia archaeon]
LSDLGKGKAISRSLPLKAVILFGSYAEGRHTAASDVGLLIVYEDPKREGDYGICWDALKIPQAEILVYTESEYEGLMKGGAMRGDREQGDPRLGESKGCARAPLLANPWRIR